ncbi:MAG: TolB family protein [bacterium]
MKGAIRYVVVLIWIGSLFVPTAGWGEDFAGYELLVTSIRTGNPDIFLVNPETGDARNLTRHPADDRYPAWAPDGRRFTFTSDRDGAFNIYAADSEGGRLFQLTHEKSPTVCFYPTWAANGTIAFGRDTGGKVEIRLMKEDGSEPRFVGPGTDPCLSPDGRRIAFTRKAGQGFCVFVMDADGGNVRPISTRENELGAVVPTFSPDGTRILYSDQVGGALEIFVCDAQEGNPRQLTFLGKLSTSAAWSPDGRWITFRVTESAFWRDTAEREKAYREKRGDLRPVYLMGGDGADPHVIETLRYQCAVDGSRAVWRPD